jgi:hypothetical protein
MRSGVELWGTRYWLRLRLDTNTPARAVMPVAGEVLWAEDKLALLAAYRPGGRAAIYLVAP